MSSVHNVQNLAANGSTTAVLVPEGVTATVFAGYGTNANFGGGSLQLQISLDGTKWWNYLAPEAALGTFNVGFVEREIYVRAILTGATTPNLDVTVVGVRKADYPGKSNNNATAFSNLTEDGTVTLEVDAGKEVVVFVGSSDASDYDSGFVQATVKYAGARYHINVGAAATAGLNFRSAGVLPFPSTVTVTLTGSTTADLDVAILAGL